MFYHRLPYESTPSISVSLTGVPEQSFVKNDFSDALFGLNVYIYLTPHFNLFYTGLHGKRCLYCYLIYTRCDSAVRVFHYPHFYGSVVAHPVADVMLPYFQGYCSTRCFYLIPLLYQKPSGKTGSSIVTPVFLGGSCENFNRGNGSYGTSTIFSTAYGTKTSTNSVTVFISGSTSG